MPTTAARNAGVCEPCKKGTRASIEQAKQRPEQAPEIRQLEFRASEVSAQTMAYTEDHHVHGVHFGVGDPETDGHHWNFTRSFEDDDGVCTVREIQVAVVYDGIKRFVLDRESVVCEFDNHGQRATGFSVLEIFFDLTESEWLEVAAMLDRVFRDRDCFTRAAEPGRRQGEDDRQTTIQPTED